MVQLDGALNLVRLQRADKMQPHVWRTLEQGRPFGFRFLDPVLAKQTVSGSDGIGNSVYAMGLANSDQGNGFRVAARCVRCLINPGLDGAKILENVCWV
tara:strand:- start:395 stop:691 length:297 start_codon:yes stop_codon:yes gene_type:complete